MSGLAFYFRTVFMAAAGIGAFYSTAHWTRDQGESHNEIAEAVSHAAPAASQPVAEQAPHAAASAVERSPGLTLGDRTRSIPKASGVLFSNLSWLPPPPPPPPPAPAPPPPKPVAPVAPPMPFTFVGMLERGAAKPAAFLAKGEALLVVSAGDILDNSTYRVDVLNANEIVMTYLPMNIQQTLRVSGGTR